MQLEELGKLIKVNYLIQSQTCDLLACNMVPQSLCYCVLPGVNVVYFAK
jgi:hypothetical protein